MAVKHVVYSGLDRPSTNFAHRERASARRHRLPVCRIDVRNGTREEGLRAERTRIARELHDTLLQGFCSVSMQLQAAVGDLPADSAVTPRFSHVVELVHRVLEEGRAAIQGLRSPRPDPPSLGQALAGIPALLGLSAAARFSVIVEGRRRQLQAGLSDELYHIGREAIVNAYRHSGAKDIETVIEYRPDGLHVCVRDNGRGIDPEVVRCGRDGHWGLQGMRERAERIGARLRVSSRPAMGTEVEFRVPGRLAFEPTEASGD